MDSEREQSLYWKLARRNYAVYRACQGYLTRHPHAFLRKWNSLRRYERRYRPWRGLAWREITQEQLIQLFERHEIISFDIFDTLLCRRARKPTDVFRSVQEKTGTTGFCEARILAEKQARLHHPEQEDVTLEQIYRELPEPLQRMDRKELDGERAVVCVKESMVPVFQAARQTGKRVILCSDMYLPKAFLEELLQKNRFDGYTDFFLSSESMKTKVTGNLFRQMIEKTGASPEQILHIGDDPDSDGNAAVLGMSFVHLNRDRFFEVYR